MIEFSELGPDVKAGFNIDRLQRLEAEFGEKYTSRVRQALDSFDLNAIRKVAEIAVDGATFNELADTLPLTTIASRLNDALSITLYGKVYSEHLEALAIERFRTSRRHQEIRARLIIEAGEDIKAELAAAVAMASVIPETPAEVVKAARK